jgi:hypothetical protein
MRVIGNIEHPHLKITIFKMDSRISVKFENGLYEQTYKLGQDERLSTVEAIQQWVDARLLEEVSAVFQHMHRLRMESFARIFPAGDDSEFEDIV